MVASLSRAAKAVRTVFTRSDTPRLPLREAVREPLPVRKPSIWHRFDLAVAPRRVP